MQTLDYLRDPVLRAIYLPGLLAGGATVLMCGLLSPLVVVKRLGFIGQGVSHSAFGGIGVASLLAAWGLIAVGGAAEFAVVAAFCVAAALGMGGLSGGGGEADARGGRRTPEDTAIGLFLVGSMALGAILVQAARGIAQSHGRAADVRSWESILFGSVALAGQAEVELAAGVLACVTGALWLLRRPLAFWAFDQDSARAFGVPTRAVHAILMVLLALVVVTAMKVAGVVLASALLVLPGAAALRVSDTLRTVTVFSCVGGAIGLLGGYLMAFELGWQPGPCIVAVLVGLFGVGVGVDRWR